MNDRPLRVGMTGMLLQSNGKSNRICITSVGGESIGYYYFDDRVRNPYTRARDKFFFTEDPMSDLTITKEAVVKAAETCPDAKKVLQTLFPEAFGPPPVSITTNPGGGFLVDGMCGVIEVREGGRWMGQAFWLDQSAHIWRLEKEGDTLCLIPTRKR